MPKEHNQNQIQIRKITDKINDSFIIPFVFYFGICASSDKSLHFRLKSYFVLDLKFIKSVLMQRSH